MVSMNGRRICLIDADSKIPNLALMKLSAYHKSQGNSVKLYRAGLPYYPNRRKKVFGVPLGYDKYYCSVVFQGNKDFIQGTNISFGGTGYSLDIELPGYIESLAPDYSIYPENDTSYGFITRGCIRKCKFCFVPKKEGGIHCVNRVDDIVKHKQVKFLDNNILAYENHIEILQELVDKRIKCCFNQGLDIRLLNETNSKLLRDLNYLGEYSFSFDDYSYLKIIERKLPLLDWCKPYQLRFFVYCSPSMDLADTVKRVEWLRRNKCLTYFMRDISCWESEYNHFYIDLAAYTNQVHLYKTMTFVEFLNRRHKNQGRITFSKNLYEANQ